MRNFLRGMAIGVPLGMLLGDVRAELRVRAWERRARHWSESGREKASQMAERAVRAAEEKLRRIPGNTGANLGELLHHGRERPEPGRIPVLNRVSREELLRVYGIGEVLADRILQGRPYQSDHEVVERGILSETVFQNLRRQLLDRVRRTA